ncbi:hypothetical protein QVD17_03284 [Tagetes erecta]|uniref:Uncharacterized protein n=1 Tax=Tagetes erecta TaxID=13708 RepID=A0AAD8P8I7_TARER|nr:hypothetical protein QVD17_03284 [Tagetes erecta]
MALHNANADDHGVNWCQRICRNRTCTGVLKSGYIHIKEIGLQKIPEVKLDTYKDRVVGVKTKFVYHIRFEKKVKVKPYLDLVTYDFGLYDWRTNSPYHRISTYSSKYTVLEKEQIVTVNFEANLTRFTKEEQKEIKNVIDGGRAMMVFSGYFKWHAARDRFFMGYGETELKRAYKKLAHVIKIWLVDWKSGGDVDEYEAGH